MATEYDLLTPGEVTIGDAIFSNEASVIDLPAGTGVIDPFVRIQGTGIEQGFNYDSANIGGPAPLDVKSGPWTTILSLDSMLHVTVAGVDYVEFRLDINENDNDIDKYLSLDQLKIYGSTSSGLYGYDPATGTWQGGSATLAYNMDKDADSWLAMNYGLYSGSGESDLAVLVPLSDFAPGTEYVYLYSSFGEQKVDDSGRDWGGSDGFEEWYSLKGANPPTTYSVSGVKYEDLNGGTNSQVDADKTLSGWKIDLYLDDGDGVFGAGDTLVATATTGSDGAYAFSGLTTGSTYFLQEELKTGWTEIADTNHPSVWTVTQAATDRNFFNTQLAEISGYKLSVLDGLSDPNGTTTPLRDWVINLYADANGNDAVDPGEALVATTITDSGGAFDFKNLMLGKYVVQEVLQTGWAAVTPASVAVDLGTSGATVPVTFENTNTFQVSGAKYEDMNGTAGGANADKPLAGWTVTLYQDDGDGKFNAADSVVGTPVITDANGAYTFTGLTTGTQYWIAETMQDGWMQVTDGTHPVVWGVNQAAPNPVSGDNFYNAQYGKIEGDKLIDTNHDKVGDVAPDKPWVIFLDLNNDGKFNWTDLNGDKQWQAGEGDRWTLTDANGHYVFDNLAPGNYSVYEVQRSGYQNEVAPINPLTVTSGADLTGKDFVNDLAWEGLTFGYWKTHSFTDNGRTFNDGCVFSHHDTQGNLLRDSQGNVILLKITDPALTFRDVFAVGDQTVKSGNTKYTFDADLTLKQVLQNSTAGGIYELARQAVAAMLNNCATDINYEFTKSVIINDVQGAWAVNTWVNYGAVGGTLAAANNVELADGQPNAHIPDPYPYSYLGV